MRNQRRVPCWAIIQPADDIPGVWVGHCLDLDVVTQGDSPEHALRMVHEASAMTLSDDLARGAEPTARRAPHEYWRLLSKILHQGQRVQDIQEAAEIAEKGHDVALIAVQFLLSVDDGTDLDQSLDVPFFLLPSREHRAAC